MKVATVSLPIPDNGCDGSCAGEDDNVRTVNEDIMAVKDPCSTLSADLEDVTLFPSVPEVTDIKPVLPIVVNGVKLEVNDADCSEGTKREETIDPRPVLEIVVACSINGVLEKVVGEAPSIIPVEKLTRGFGVGADGIRGNDSGLDGSKLDGNTGRLTDPALEMEEGTTGDVDSERDRLGVRGREFGSIELLVGRGITDMDRTESKSTDDSTGKVGSDGMVAMSETLAPSETDWARELVTPTDAPIPKEEAVSSETLAIADALAPKESVPVREAITSSETGSVVLVGNSGRDGTEMLDTRELTSTIAVCIEEPNEGIDVGRFTDPGGEEATSNVVGGIGMPELGGPLNPGLPELRDVAKLGDEGATTGREDSRELISTIGNDGVCNTTELMRGLDIDTDAVIPRDSESNTDPETMLEGVIGKLIEGRGVTSVGRAKDGNEESAVGSEIGKVLESSESSPAGRDEDCNGGI